MENKMSLKPHALLVMIWVFCLSSSEGAENHAVIEIKEESLASCPTFHVTLSATGLVRYRGFENVVAKGPRESTLSREITRALFLEFDEARFFDLDDRRDQSLTRYKRRLNCETDLAYMPPDKGLIE